MKNELYTPIKESKLANIQHFFLPHEPENVGTDAVSELKRTDLLVAEASFPSTGQSIELVQAKAANVPIVCFYRVGTKPSGSLRFVTNKSIEYTGKEDLLAKIQTELDKLIAIGK